MTNINASKSGAHTGSALRRCLLAGSAVAAMALAAPAWAQDAAADADSQGGLEAITVTAQKRAQDLQDVSIAVTAVTNESLQQARIENLEDLQVLVPNISFGNDFNVAKIFIRGVGTNTSTNGTDPAVALYVDGAVIGRPEAQFASLFDLERVEVLRGPQGTLFGRNAVGGAISLITAKPTEELSGYARFSVGNYSAFLAEGAISGPLSDKILARVAFRGNVHSGFGKNNFTGSDIDDLQKVMARGQLEFKASDDISMLVSAEWYDQDDNANAVKFKQAAFPGIPALFPLGQGGFATNPRDLNGEFDNRNQMRTWAITGTFDWRLSDTVALKSITNYRKFNQQLLQDLDMSSTVNSLATTGQSTTIQNRNPFSEQLSQELQLNYDSDFLQGVVGAYYIDEDFGTYPNNIGLTPTHGQPENNIALAAAGLPTSTPPIPRFYTLRGRQEANAVALFADLTFNVTDQFALKLGGRYSHEKRFLDNAGIIIARGGRGPVLQISGYDERTFKDFTPKAGLEYRPTDDLLLYYTYSEGFKSGTGELTITTNGIIEPETIRAHEAGLKSTLFDNSLIFNLAVFYNKLKGLQVNRTIFDPVAGFRTIYENATSTKAHGVEADIKWLVTDGFRIDFSGAYLKSTFGNYVTNDPLDPRNIVGSPVFAPVNVNLSGKYTRYSPKWTFSVHGEYDIELTSGGVFTMVGDVAYKGRQYHSEFNRPEMSQPAYTLADASIRYTAPSNWSAQLWVNNLTDETVEAGTFSLATAREIGRTFLPPRTWGATFGYKF